MSSRDIIEEKLERLKSSLLNTAILDGQISTEERLILNAVTYSIDNLEDMLDKAFDDGIITPEEKKELINLVNRIGDEAETIASFDDYLSKDEKSMITRLKRALVDINANIDKL